MSLSVDDIVAETRHWPSAKVDELLIRLHDEHSANPEVEAAWREEIGKRVSEIENGNASGLPLEDSLARIRTIAGL